MGIELSALTISANAIRIARHLEEARVLRRVAGALSLRQARAAVLQAAIEHEQQAALLAAS
jgi:hypothetical protein